MNDSTPKLRTIDTRHDCRFAEGFTWREKLYAQSSFLAMGIIGTIGIVRVDWIWVLPYVVIFWYGVPGVIMRHLACPRCPHLHVYGDCVQFPAAITKRLVKNRRNTPFNPLERILFYAILFLVPVYPLYWLSGQVYLLVPFVIAAVMWYLGQWLHFCRHCRVQQCPFNRAGAVEHK